MRNILPEQLSAIYKGEFTLSETYRILYSTDASIYREKPLGVAYPSNDEEVWQLVQFANTF
jgi:FAD/FMN-containing dehydrogenase